MPRSDNRSMARSTDSDALRAPVSVFGVGRASVVGGRREAAVVPGGTGPGMVGGSPGLVSVNDLQFHRVHLFLIGMKGGCQGE